MAYTLTVQSGKPGTRRVTRQSSPRDVASLTADDGNTRVEVELSPYGEVHVTVTREFTHERRTVSFPAPKFEGYAPKRWIPNLPTIASYDHRDDAVTITGPDHDKLHLHLCPLSKGASGMPACTPYCNGDRHSEVCSNVKRSKYRTNFACDSEVLCGAEYHVKACPSYGRAGTGVTSGH